MSVTDKQYRFMPKAGPLPEDLRGLKWHSDVMDFVDTFLAWNTTAATKRLPHDEAKIKYVSRISFYEIREVVA